MKPCVEMKERIALFAASAIPADEAAALREHIENCAGCRAYWEGVRMVCHQHGARGRQWPEAVPSHDFHGRLVRRIEEHVSRRSWFRWSSEAFAWAAFPRWAMAASFALIVALTVIWWSLSRPSSEDRRLAVTNPANVPIFNVMRPLPSLARYRQVLNKSVDELDALLTREGLEVTPRKQSSVSVRDRSAHLLARSDILRQDIGSP